VTAPSAADVAEATRLAAIAAPDPTAADVTEARYRATCLADVTAERVDWLWPGWIPRGMTTVLDGPPGAGKSTLTLVDRSARALTDLAKLDTGTEGGPPELLGNHRQRALLAAVDHALDATNDEGRRLIMEALRGE